MAAECDDCHDSLAFQAAFNWPVLRSTARFPFFPSLLLLPLSSLHLYLHTVGASCGVVGSGKHALWQKPEVRYGLSPNMTLRVHFSLEKPGQLAERERVSFIVVSMFSRQDLHRGMKDLVQMGRLRQE